MFRGKATYLRRKGNYIGLRLFINSTRCRKITIQYFKSEGRDFYSRILSSVHSLSCVQFFATTSTAARQASLSITNARSLLKLISIESVMPSNHLILCRPLPLPPSIFPSIWVFAEESVLCNRWPKDWSFSFSISPSRNIQD